ISAIADEKLRGAIGALCVHWALLELAVERVIANLEGNPQVIAYSEDLAHRTETLKDLAKSSGLTPAQKTTLCSLASDIKQLGHDRHRYVHCLWGLDASGNLISLFPRTKVGEQGEPASAAQIRQTKLKTWQLTKKLLQFVEKGPISVLPSR